MNVNLRDIFKPGDRFHGATSVQADWVVTDVYPNWLKAKNTKDRKFGRTGSRDPYVLKAGKEATFTIGDLVVSGAVRQ